MYYTYYRMKWWHPWKLYGGPFNFKYTAEDDLAFCKEEHPGCKTKIEKEWH